ncbi:hypothetical protein HBI70_045180 [Parastagonospora nodorum]|nr:hypothetical protein HBH46_024990 [Parastagonospora nodorum]KAH4167286.1 hypothetical protein HBH43_126340 [Parastagonospora nodorum]KAH4818531.1 hypothetical protein HBH61_040770 [Parastagonospora nodorum]KAH5066882.1 hypothetical protein HBH96_032300 [Parastagonospora nodorum]KAH5081551.1 hypothetical protein HBH95_059760 [Parastagonospora nodorum]
MRNNIFSNPASAAIFFAKFSRLDPATRRNVFRLLADDLYTAVDLAVDQPQYAHEVGSVLFRSYRATSPRQLFVFSVALTAVRDFSPHVQTIILSSPFDDPGQSGFYEWLYEFAGWTLPAGHLGLPVQHIGWNLVDLCINRGLNLVNGRLQGTHMFPPNWQHTSLLRRVLPALCPNVVRLELPIAWGPTMAHSARTGFPNAVVVPRP